MLSQDEKLGYRFASRTEMGKADERRNKFRCPAVLPQFVAAAFVNVVVREDRPGQAEQDGEVEQSAEGVILRVIGRQVNAGDSRSLHQAEVSHPAAEVVDQ